MNTHALRHLFERYRDFRLSLSELRAVLGDRFVYHRHGDDHIISLAPDIDVPLPVTAADLQRVLQITIDRQATSEELETWANLVILFDGFAIEGDEDLVTIVHEIASPQLYGELDDGRLRTLYAEATRLMAVG